MNTAKLAKSACFTSIDDNYLYFTHDNVCQSYYNKAVLHKQLRE